MKKERWKIIGGNAVSRLETYTLGGYKQKVLIEGKRAENPVLISLHGGPGMPVPFSIGSRGLFPEYTEPFIMVYWDQLGCGANDHIIDDSFSVDSFAAMTIDLVKQIKKEFPRNQLILMGTSWGSVLAAKAAEKLPGLVDNVFVYGQILENLFFNDEVFEALERVTLPDKVRSRLKALYGKKNYTQDDVKEIAGYIRKYTEGYQAKSGEKMPMGSFIAGMLKSPDYKLKDFLAVFKNGFLKNNSIWVELPQLNLRETLKNIKIPYTILQGDKDIVTSTKAVAAFVNEAGNANLTCKVIAHNGHIPGAGGMDEILKAGKALVSPR